jgi:hypothetical protein
MTKYITNFYSDPNDYPEHSIESETAVVAGIGDSIRFHTTEPSDRYTVVSIKRELTILKSELVAIESKIYLKRE